MLIDWFTVVAQIVNFLILVALLRRFLYGPIVRAMDAREAGIAARVREAEEAKAAAAAQAESLRQRQAKLDAERDGILDGAAKDAERMREEVIDRARTDAAELGERWRRTIRAERESFLTRLKQASAQEVLAVSRRALADLAGADLEPRLVAAFLAQLDRLEEASPAPPDGSAGAGARTVVVRTAFDLGDDLRDRVRSAVLARFGADVEPRFRRDDSIVTGIELTADGRRYAWSVDRYLADLAERVDGLIESGTPARPSPAAEEKRDAG